MQEFSGLVLFLGSYGYRHRYVEGIIGVAGELSRLRHRGEALPCRRSVVARWADRGPGDRSVFLDFQPDGEPSRGGRASADTEALDELSLPSE